jgi:predicted ATP-dependent Lon-type protease
MADTKWLDDLDMDDEDAMLAIYGNIQDAVANSDDYRPVVNLLLHYREHPVDREMIDRVLIWLCGWSLPTLATGEHDDQKIDFKE